MGHGSAFADGVADGAKKGEQDALRLKLQKQKVVGLPKRALRGLLLRPAEA
jgi:hypothetical protein